MTAPTFFTVKGAGNGFGYHRRSKQARANYPTLLVAVFWSTTRRRKGTRYKLQHLNRTIILQVHRAESSDLQGV